MSIRSQACSWNRLLHFRHPLLLILLLLVSGTGLFLGGCSGTTDSERSRSDVRDDQVLFQVNGVERTVYDFERAYTEHLIATGRSDTRGERNAYLTKLIDELLLAASAADKGLLTHPTYRSAIEHEQRKSMIDTYFVDQMEEEIPPLTDEEIRLAYAKRLRTAYIRQLYSKDPVDLEEAYQALENGENFVDVANRFYETSTYDSLAGYLGPVSYFGIDDAVAEAAYSINQGDYSEPVRSRLGYHIIYVEHIEFPAMLTEDQYQYRKQGVESQLRLRRQRLVSGDYIFRLMSSLNVQTNNPNILELRDIIQNLDGDAILEMPQTGDVAENVWTDDRVKQLAGSFDKKAELATFDMDGERQTFTFGDYINWLPYLSFQESKVRLGASVGRGLRNQVLYELASKAMYDGDDRVVKKLQIRSSEILSDLHQYELTIEALQDTAQVEVPEEFRTRLISSRDLTLRAGYWKVPAENLQHAKRLKQELEQGADPAGIEGYKEVPYGMLGPNTSDYDLVRRSILDVPVIGFAAEEGWMVLNVLEREIEETGTETRGGDLQRSYKVYETIQSEIDSLRTIADIEIDTELFNAIYNVWSPVQTGSSK